jgi:L-asparaginase II
MTLRQALRLLSDEGLVVQQPGRGTFVAPPRLAYQRKALRSLSDELRSQGIDDSPIVFDCACVFGDHMVIRAERVSNMMSWSWGLRSRGTDVRVAVLAEVVRGGVVESTHTGTVVLLDADGRVARAAGRPDEPMLPRSALKPLQAVGMVTAGLDVAPELLALAAASHTGEPRHVDLVERLLATVSLPVTALRNKPGVPLDPVRAADPGPSAVGAPCSGKHAAMIATCVCAGWPVEDYQGPDHPLQRWLRREVERLTGTRAGAMVFDGCGAPTFTLPLTALAWAMRLLVLAAPGSPERRVADAMRAHPEVVGGEVRAVTHAMRAVPGLLAKDGAEGVVAFALADGRAGAVKVHDGADRALGSALLGALAAWSVASAEVHAALQKPAEDRCAAHVRMVPLDRSTANA